METASLLTKCAALGPIAGADRAPTHEFRRVYRFLHYNEASRVHAVVDELLTSLQRRNAAPPATRNAWNYVVGAYDRWIMRARVVYVAVGLLEGTLRSRLNARMTDVYGAEWFTLSNCVPSSVRDQLEKESAIRSLNNSSVEERSFASDFVAHLDYGQLRSFFQAKRLWSKGPRLEQLFVFHDNSPSPLLRSAVDAQLGIIHRIRNEVAHYRPAPESRFATALYACARVARWLGVDLQHFYGAVDTRMSTELSIFIDDRDQLPTAGVSNNCAEKECAIGAPLDLILDAAPLHRSELDAPDGARWACQYHRIRFRQVLHRPSGE